MQLYFYCKLCTFLVIVSDGQKSSRKSLSLSVIREPGGILAAMSDGLDKAVNEVCRTSLKSGKHETYLSVIPELEEVGETSCTM